MQSTEQRNAAQAAGAKAKQSLWRSKGKDAASGGSLPSVEVLDKDGNRCDCCPLHTVVQ